LTLQMN